jgi:hypothetical protein
MIKLTPEIVELLRIRRRAGERAADLAKEYSMCERAIADLVQGKSWPDAPGPIHTPVKVRPLADRFWSHVEKLADNDACWLWRASMGRGGYGQITVHLATGKRPVLAHRISWELAHGPVPGTLWVLHRCDNPRCVNPAHLFLGTAADNAADMAIKRRSTARIPDEVVRLVRRARDEGISQPEVARRYGVSEPWVNAVVHRRSRSGRVYVS